MLSFLWSGRRNAGRKSRNSASRVSRIQLLIIDSGRHYQRDSISADLAPEASSVITLKAIIIVARWDILQVVMKSLPLIRTCAEYCYTRHLIPHW